jgi:MFS family permease
MVTSLAGETVDSARAWLIATAAALSMFTVFGVAYSFGAFFDSMSDEFDVGSGATALVFSITISISFVLGLWTGRASDRFGPRPVMVAGAGLLAAGLLLTAAAPNIYIGYLTYGAGVGGAVACGYVPMVSTVGGWFERRRATAMGVAVAGIGLGTLAGAPLAAAVIDATSWRTTYVAFGIGGSALMLVAAAIARPGPAAVVTARPRGLGELLRIADFGRLYGSTIFASLGLFVPFVFIASYAEDGGAGEVAAATLLGLIGGSSVVGRLGLGALADRVGPVRLYQLSFAVMAVSHLIRLFAGDRYALLVVYTVVLGLGYGGFIALSPAVAASRFGLDGLGGVLGTLYTAAAIGSLFGPPLAGILRDELGYDAAIIFATVVSAIAVVILSGLHEQEVL